MSTPTIVSMEELVKLRKFCRWWAVGWVAAGLGLLGCGIATGGYLAEKKARTELVEIAQTQRDTIRELRETANTLEHTREKFAVAFSQQNTLSQILTSWSEYMIERYDGTKKNVAMRPFNFGWEKQHRSVGGPVIQKSLEE